MDTGDEELVQRLLAIASTSDEAAAQLLPATEFLYRQLDTDTSKPHSLTTLRYALVQFGSVLDDWENQGELSPANADTLHSVWCNLCMAAERAREHVNIRYLNMDTELLVCVCTCALLWFRV